MRIEGEVDRLTPEGKPSRIYCRKCDRRLPVDCPEGVDPMEIGLPVTAVGRVKRTDPNDVRFEAQYVFRLGHFH